MSKSWGNQRIQKIELLSKAQRQKKAGKKSSKEATKEGPAKFKMMCLCGLADQIVV